jgi:MerR family copper efflux transcriptional regulator
MLIHEAAAVTGLTIDAIRYYERQHLLDERHITRQLNGYRSYTPAAIQRLQHLKHARAQGFSKDWHYNPRCWSKLRTSAGGA